MTGAEPLTASEHHALDLTRQLANAMAGIAASGSELRADWSEFTTHLHAIQHMIMSQAAARAYPDQYRLLGAGWDDIDAHIVTPAGQRA
jgi:hypothetical protein